MGEGQAAGAMGRANGASELKTSACSYRAHPRVVSKEVTEAEAVDLAMLGEVVEQAAVQVRLVLHLIGVGRRLRRSGWSVRDATSSRWADGPGYSAGTAQATLGA